MTDSKARHFNSYDDFFVYYLTQHSDRTNRLLHACGTGVSIAFIIAMIATGHGWWALTWPLIAYSFAWFGHFVVEGNKPATFGHPWWSFISDFRMVWLMITGRLGRYISTSGAIEPSSPK
jgi:hypothetical protein